MNRNLWGTIELYFLGKPKTIVASQYLASLRKKLLLRADVEEKASTTN
jgi:hypothetical protein